MDKVTVAVCDIDTEYRDRFVTYLVERKTGKYAVYAFSTVEHFLDALSKQIFEVVVFGRGFEEAKGVVRERNIPLLILKDDTTECLEEVDKIVSVFRYQPVEAILHEMQVLLGNHYKEVVLDRTISHLEVIGVYSPICHEMQMPFSIVFAEMMAERRKVLYVNLMQYSGFLEVFGLSGRYDIGDIILRLRNNRLCAETFLKCLYESNRVHYIPPFHNPEDLRNFTLRDYMALMEFLEKSTNFEVVIFDFGKGLESFPKMLRACGSVYCPMKTGYFYECRLNEFLSYLEKSTVKDVRECLHMINLPFSARQIRGGGDVRKQLLWSEFGDYIRNYFKGGSV